MKNRSNFLVLLLAVAIGSSFDIMHAQEKVDPWLQEFVQVFKENGWENFIKIDGCNVSAFRSSRHAHTALLAAPFLGLFLVALSFSWKSILSQSHVLYVPLADLWAICAANPNQPLAPRPSQLYPDIALIISLAIFIGSIVSLARLPRIAEDNHPYIIFDEQGLIFDKKRLLGWSAIQDVTLEKFTSLFDPPHSHVCFKDCADGVITLTDRQLKRLPLTLQNIVELSKHYIAKAKAAGDQETSAQSVEQAVIKEDHEKTF